VTELGAERFLDLDRERFEQVAEAVDLVVDLVGGEVLQRSVAAVKDAGVVVSAVEDPRPWVDRAGRARGAYFVVEPARSELQELARRADTGELRPVVGEVVDLADGAKAFQAKRGGRVPGKVVLRIADQ
jgi:NADPH:quinone reductase-like Zn-dependent oxidoreductase